MTRSCHRSVARPALSWRSRLAKPIALTPTLPAAAAATLPTPLLVAIEMGYGHLRAAHALASALNVPIFNADDEPLADPAERRQWARARRFYEFVSRASQMPVVGGGFDAALGALTSIPQLYPRRDLSAPTLAVRYLANNVASGLGRGLVERLSAQDGTLLTTFYAPAIAADIAGLDNIHCVVTDADVNRIWVAPQPARTRIHYLVPGLRTARRLRAYGVPASRITFTGFPLPPELLGGHDLPLLRRNLAARLGRLDPGGTFRDAYGDDVEHFLGKVPAAQVSRAPLITFAVGGAGAQSDLPQRFLPGFRRPLEEGRLRLALVAGVRLDVSDRFFRAIAQAGCEHLVGDAIQVLEAPNLPTYFSRFNALLAETDVLWTKPSELTFFGALGLPIVFAPPVGRHEDYNLRWSREAGAGVKQRDPRFMAERLLDWIEDGTLAGAAWSGYMRLPKFGTYRIASALRDRRPSATQFPGDRSGVVSATEL
jgi:hypothetical protein